VTVSITEIITVIVIIPLPLLATEADVLHLAGKSEDEVMLTLLH